MILAHGVHTGKTGRGFFSFQEFTSVQVGHLNIVTTRNLGRSPCMSPADFDSYSSRWDEKSSGLRSRVRHPGGIWGWFIVAFCHTRETFISLSEARFPSHPAMPQNPDCGPLTSHNISTGPKMTDFQFLVLALYWFLLAMFLVQHHSVLYSGYGYPNHSVWRSSRVNIPVGQLHGANSLTSLFSNI